MNKFQDFVSNKQILELQAELEQKKGEIEKLKNIGIFQGDLEEVYYLRNQLIKCQDENLELKKLITSLNRQKGQYAHIDQFFQYFNIPNIQAIGIKFQLIIDQFINLKQENEEKNQKLLEFSQLQIEYRELLSKMTIMDQHLQMKQNQLDKAEGKIQSMVKLIEKQRQDQMKEFWDLRVNCDNLSQLIEDGWKSDIGNFEGELSNKVIFVISQHYNLLNTEFDQKKVIDNHVYFKIKDGILYILKHIECTSSSISQVDQQVEALDEFWMMFALLQNYPINILNYGENILLDKVQFMKQLLNSESQLYQNQMVPYQIEVNLLNIRFQIAQFAQQSFDWFFEKKDEMVIVSDYNKFIKLNANATIKLARETSLLHYITDYYQVVEENRLMLCIQSTIKEEIKVKKYQVNTGVVALVELGRKQFRICKIINTSITTDTTIQQDDNYVYIYL